MSMTHAALVFSVQRFMIASHIRESRSSLRAPRNRQDIKYIRIYRLGRESAILSCYVLWLRFIQQQYALTCCLSRQSDSFLYFALSRSSNRAQLERKNKSRS